MLFHGTNAVEAIVNSVDGHGFLPMLAGTSTGAIWGDGTYFARDARYSDDYARTLPSGDKQMMLVDVLVDLSTKGAQGMKVCPFLPGQSYARYNSLVNRVQDPSIFVVQHSNQAYPSYLITYHQITQREASSQTPLLHSSSHGYRRRGSRELARERSEPVSWHRVTGLLTPMRTAL